MNDFGDTSPHFHVLSQMELGNYLYDRLSSVSDVRIYGPAPSRTVKRAALCSFNVKDIHPTDIATFLDQQVWEINLHPTSCITTIFYTYKNGGCL